MKASFILWISIFLNTAIAQSNYVSEIQLERDKHIQKMIDPAQGILNQEELANYISHDYYEIDPQFCLNVKLKKVKPETLIIPTSSGKSKRYRVVGKVIFKLPGQEQAELSIFQDIALALNPEFKDYYFIPFRDATTAVETYGAGRYLDVTIKGRKLVLDFNKAYNPYCAFSYRYNCPIPPDRNHLKISITAGEKTPRLRE